MRANEVFSISAELNREEVEKLVFKQVRDVIDYQEARRSWNQMRVLINSQVASETR